MSAALRPTFSVELGCPSGVALQRLFKRLEAGPYSLRRTRGVRADATINVNERDHFVLTVADDQQHLWSPWLNVEVSPRGDGSHLFARFSPHPSVWTGYAFAYIGLTTALLLSLCFSWALVVSGSSPWSLGISALAAFIMVALWVAAQVGQRLAHDQMDALRGELQSALSACIEVGPREVHPIGVEPSLATQPPT